MNQEDHNQLILNAFPDYIWENIPQNIILKIKKLYFNYFNDNNLYLLESSDDFINLPEKAKHHLLIRIEYYNDNYLNK